MVHTDTFNFLLDLKEHNTKDWFDENRGRYQEARNNVISITDQLLEGIAEFDPSLEGIEPKKCLFRINRDVRFSNNKDPYKTNFGISMASGGKNSGNAGYYVNIDPAEGFAGGGFYMPPSPILKKVRAHIDLHGEELEKAVSTPAFKKIFGELDAGKSLKTAPKGFPKDHPHIHFLRMKSFTAIKSINLDDMNSEKMVPLCLEAFEAISPLIRFLNDGM
ncbi:MAG: DUF2461 domain-containing protein [Bacteroidia bacterium]|nr:DUF2461 domain-containing protein [Bacteroidia bacterium]